MYSASQDDKATVACFWDLQEIGGPSGFSMKAYPLVLRRSSVELAQSFSADIHSASMFTSTCSGMPSMHTWAKQPILVHCPLRNTCQIINVNTHKAPQSQSKKSVEQPSIVNLTPRQRTGDHTLRAVTPGVAWTWGRVVFLDR